MPITETELRETLEQAFPNAEIALQDMAGDDDHWQATIRCDSFADKSRIEQHQMVQAAVANKDIHALSIKTEIP